MMPWNPGFFSCSEQGSWHPSTPFKSTKKSYIKESPEGKQEEEKRGREIVTDWRDSRKGKKGKGTKGLLVAHDMDKT